MGNLKDAWDKFNNNDNLKSDCLSELDFNSIKTNIGIIIDEQDN
mgnify:CR=1 FL=1